MATNSDNPNRLIPIREVADHGVPAIGWPKMSYSAVYRLIDVGQSVEGKKVRLRSVKLGARVHVRASDLSRFVKEVADAREARLNERDARYESAAATPRPRRPRKGYGVAPRRRGGAAAACDVDAACRREGV